MAHVVAEPCINCKYTDCVAVCPVDCFHEGVNFLVIDPETCIDCGLCAPECPTSAIDAQKEPMPGADEAAKEDDKRDLLDPDAFQG